MSEHVTENDQLPSELRSIADTIETNGGWHIAALKVRAAADEMERLTSVADAEMKLREGNFSEIERLRDALAGIVGLVQLLRNNDDIPAEVRKNMLLNHRYLEGLQCLSR